MRFRSLQQPAMEIWGGQAANVAAAQRALLEQVANNRAAVGVGEGEALTHKYLVAKVTSNQLA